MILQRDKTVPGEMIERSMLAVQFANNLLSGKLYATPGTTYMKAVDYVFDFGYEESNTVIIPGYADNNPVKITGKGLMATVVKRQDGEVLLLIGNVSKNDVKGKFDLGKVAKGTIYDAESNQIIGKGSKFTLSVDKYGYRLIRIGKAPSGGKAESSLADWNKADRAKLEFVNNVLKISDIRNDHHIYNRNLQLEAAKVSNIVIEYRAKGIPAKTIGQLYFANGKQGFGSPRVFRLPSLKGDNKLHKITIKTSKNPEWLKTGKITAIRLDMMDQTGEAIEIKDIKFQ